MHVLQARLAVPEIRFGHPTFPGTPSLVVVQIENMEVTACSDPETVGAVPVERVNVSTRDVHPVGQAGCSERRQPLNQSLVQHAEKATEEPKEPNAAHGFFGVKVR
ncbi:hypothetical protein SuNHUV7_06820 (plasmid) [Pseudoseohaeicola sp. NH-UV-7]